MPLDPRFSSDRIKADVSFLADDLLEGRRTGTRGHEIAALYAAQRFAALGLKPAGDNGGWFQRIRLLTALPADPPGQLIVSGPAGSRTFTDGTDMLLRIGLSHQTVDLTAPTVFVGYGISDRRLGIDDYAGLDVRGKVVVALRGFPVGLPSEEGAFAWDRRAATAEAHGAVAIISVNTNVTEKSEPFKDLLRYRTFPRLTWIGGDGKPFDETPGLEAAATVDTATATALLAGAPRDLAAILREADRSGGRPRGFPLKVQVHLTGALRTEQVTSPNVAAVLPGNDPKLAGEYIVLSGHLDHLGIDTPEPGEPANADHINNGALDNAMGSATVLEVARVMASEAPPRRSVIFLLVTGEEEGLLGADCFARHSGLPAGAIVGNVNVDMPVLLFSFTDVVALGAEHSTIGAAVVNAARPMKLALSPDPQPEETNFIRSDNYAFVKQGVPAVSLDLGFANGGRAATKDFLENHYHQPSDDLSLPINWRGAARFAEVNWRIAHAMADADARPMWYQGDLFGDTFAPGTARAAK
jgi:hypothetical protein